MGIPAERLGDIFEMFSQVKDSSIGPTAGLGIGLSLVRGLAELHGGRAEAKSDGHGKGSEFIVHLPLSAPDGVVVEAPAPLETALPDLRLLVADDLHDSADAIAAYFRALGHEVEVAYDGEEALKLADKFRPDVALLDVGMPRLDGHEVCRAIRKEDWGKGIFVVALTGWGQASDRKLTHEAGFDHHLVKPVELETLISVLQKSLPHRRTN